MTTLRPHLLALATLALLSACDAPDETPEQLVGEGLAYDSENPGIDFSPKADQFSQYAVPDWVLDAELKQPEIRISLDGLSVHLFDRGSDLSRVYPTGPGVLNRLGNSVTPVGFFATASDSTNWWWNISQRFSPAYFGGFPFLRLTTHNSRGENTYGLHGPITYACAGGGKRCSLSNRYWYLVHDYVSHGCLRMDEADIVELFYLIKGHESVPVTIQKRVELDVEGNAIEVDDVAIDWPVGFSEDDEITYGELGKRPADWSPCSVPPNWPFRRYGC